MHPDGVDLSSPLQEAFEPLDLAVLGQQLPGTGLAVPRARAQQDDPLEVRQIVTVEVGSRSLRRVLLPPPPWRMVASPTPTMSTGKPALFVAGSVSV